LELIMRAVDSDKMLELDAAETAARLRYEDLMEKRDPAARAAAIEWQNAAKASTDYALGHVETFSDHGCP
jgi:hypothetical protein